MLWFAVAHAVQLLDGSYALRCLQVQECEARNARVELARRELAEPLRARVLQMIEADEIPPLYSFDELASCFAEQCRIQVLSSDRRPGSFDTAMIMRLMLPPAAAERYIALRTRPRTPSSHKADQMTDIETADASGPARNGADQPRTVTAEASTPGQPTALSEIEEIIGSLTLSTASERGDSASEAWPARSVEIGVEAAAADPGSGHQPATPTTSAYADESRPGPTTDDFPVPVRKQARLGMLWRASIGGTST